LSDSYIGYATTAVAPGREAYAGARAAALTALKLDEKLAEAYVPLAAVKFYHDWNWAGAERDYRRAMELKPDYATARQRYSQGLMWMGRFEEALAQINRARELDPASLIINSNVGEVLLRWRRYEQAVEEFRKTLELGDLLERSRRQYFSPFNIALVYVGLGDKDRALDWLEKAAEERARQIVFLKQDAVFDPLRGEPRFQALVRRVGLWP